MLVGSLFLSEYQCKELPFLNNKSERTDTTYIQKLADGFLLDAASRSHSYRR